jgi:hypothetical protein
MPREGLCGNLRGKEKPGREGRALDQPKPI